MNRTVTALYDDMTGAEAARRELVATGVSENKINVIAQSPQSAAGDASASAQSSQGGFWSALKDLFVADEDRHVYAEGIRRGGYLLTVEADDSQADAVIGVLENSAAVDVDERSAEWRAGGWSGGAADRSEDVHGSEDVVGEVRAEAGFDDDNVNRTGRGASVAEDLGLTSRNGGGMAGTRASTPDMGAGTAMQQSSGDGTIIPVVEERVRIGKRDSARGGVRVRSYVVETPVEEQVTLRKEHVTVERRPVNERLPGSPGDLLQERQFEVTESSEEAVVAKEAVVTEEIAVKKQVEETTETVRDTVRRTEVEVENIEDREIPRRRGADGDARPTLP